MKCEVCGASSGKRVIAGITFCDECFNKIVKLRNGDENTIDYFANSANLVDSSLKAQKYIEDIIETKKVDRMSREEIEEKKRKEAELFSKFMSTTGFNFEGYRIGNYLGIEYAETVLGTGFLAELDASISDLFGTTASTYTSKIEEARSLVIKKLMAKCIAKGANAVIGVDIDITTISNNMLVVCANGTAVEIEKE